ncbi:MAG: hypothetical protein HY918_04055 [Candidatus Doudnabacteria bacterium]|nr:hypothetical protein [Candidatus Doudnabacteria bacterium]
MNENESKFNPGYEYMADSEIRALQICLDSCWSGRSQEERDEARVKFPELIKSAVSSCKSNPVRKEMLTQFLDTNIAINYAGGVGKDLNNPIIKAIAQANNELNKKNL